MTNRVEVRLDTTERMDLAEIKRELKTKNAIEVLRLAKEANLISPISYHEALKEVFTVYFSEKMLND